MPIQSIQPPQSSFQYSTSTARSNTLAPLRTASCLIIGDEILNGKVQDTNSTYLSRFLFSLSINLVRIETIPDSTPTITETIRRLSSTSDIVITSGGIGPTHDDITYEAISSAFSLPLKLHETAWEKMKRLSVPHKSHKDFSWTEETPALEAKRRMVRLPWDENLTDKEQVCFPCENLWVPVSIVNGNVYILPGIPRLFEQLLEGLREGLDARVQKTEGKAGRILFSTPLGESHVAAYLTELSQRVKDKGVKVGSYPRFGKSRNTVTLVGNDLEYMESLVGEVEKNIKGRRVIMDNEDDSSGNESNT